MPLTKEMEDILAMSKCLKNGIKVEAVPQEQVRFGKCKIQVTKNGKARIGEHLYSQKNGELNEQIIKLYNHYAKQLK